MLKSFWTSHLEMKSRQSLYSRIEPLDKRKPKSCRWNPPKSDLLLVWQTLFILWWQNHVILYHTDGHVSFAAVRPIAVQPSQSLASSCELPVGQRVAHFALKRRKPSRRSSRETPRTLTKCLSRSGRGSAGWSCRPPITLTTWTVDPSGRHAASGSSRSTRCPGRASQTTR